MLVVEDVEPAPRLAFTALLRRRVMEWTFSCLVQSQRFSKGAQRFYATISQLMLRRLAAT
jgi:hypothetical protein